MSVSTVRIQLDEFEKMIDAGVFESDGLNERRIELIFGEMIEHMVPPNPPHEGTVDWLTRWSINQTSADQVVIRIQNSIGLAQQDSMPLPDLAWLNAVRNFCQVRPEPKGVQLVIEVSDSSRDRDLSDKARLYASAGIADYWVVDVRNFCVYVHRDPVDGMYQSIDEYQVGQQISPLAHPDVTLKLSELFASS